VYGLPDHFEEKGSDFFIKVGFVVMFEHHLNPFFMTLTKEDLEAIRKVVREESEPMREAMKPLLKAQIEIVDKIEILENEMRLVMFHLNLSPGSRELRTQLKKLE
jgi:hypothetical protein